jgi:hypothetical protein
MTRTTSLGPNSDEMTADDLDRVAGASPRCPSPASPIRRSTPVPIPRVAEITLLPILPPLIKVAPRG